MEKKKAVVTQPQTLPAIALRGLVLFPKMVLHFDIGRDKFFQHSLPGFLILYPRYFSLSSSAYNLFNSNILHFLFQDFFSLYFRILVQAFLSGGRQT